MKTTLLKQFFLLAPALLLAGCGGDAGSGSTAAPAMAGGAGTAQEVVSCPSDPGITYICGLLNAEDLLSVGDTGMILTSGMNGEDVTGHLYLVNPLDDTWEELVFGPNFSQQLDAAMFPACPGPMDVNNFSAHGLALKATGDSTFDLYITSHGGREAIEIFTLDLSAGFAALTWKGCVTLDPTIMHNSVAILPDGGFVTTEFMHWDGGIGEVFGGTPNGGVIAWHPGSEPALIPGTMVSGPNGIVVSEDARYMFVAAFGSRELVRFDLSQDPVAKDSVALDVTLDNIRWGAPGKLLTAGGNASGEGWSVVEVDATTLEPVTVGSFGADVAMQGVSSALQINNELWVGTFNGDRIGYFDRQ